MKSASKSGVIDHRHPVFAIAVSLTGNKAFTTKKYILWDRHLAPT
ncbi:hypothetical protein PN499_03780 [Kamptonema animale CS-326]|nr:hypothetical protein [Kamptonema animale]MDB9510321.1 hypothetical protein [Kamptonema animale CS-326]